MIAVDQQDDLHIYNDGTNVRFANLGRIGSTEMWAGYTAMPAWVSACTNVPYLLCDGSVYNVSAFPSLGNKLLGKFGGNGVTTFAVPDSQGRLQLPYDGTGTRITTAGCGINGQAIGGSGGAQDLSIAQNQLPNVTLSYSGTATSTNGGIVVNAFAIGPGTSGSGASPVGGSIIGALSSNFSGNTSSINGNVTQQTTPTVPPAQVTSIMVIRAG